MYSCHRRKNHTKTIMSWKWTCQIMIVSFIRKENPSHSRKVGYSLTSNPSNLSFPYACCCHIDIFICVHMYIYMYIYRKELWFIFQFIYQHGYLIYKKIIRCIKYSTPNTVSSLSSLVKNKTWFVGLNSFMFLARY